MAYKQILGRGNYSKTGNGLPSALKQIDGKVDPSKKGIHKEEGKGYVPNAYEPSTEILTSKGDKVSRLYRAASGAVNAIRKFGSKEDNESYRKFKNDSTSTMKGREFNAGRANLEEAADKAMNAIDKKKASPMKQKVSKKTAYDIKEASNQKLKPSARKHYADNAQAAMKNKKK